ncbi:MAG: endonuclease III [Phycisphaerales bacterium]
MPPADSPPIPFPLPRVMPASKARAARLADALNERYPDAVCALDYTTPHELLVATILSAQATDVGVNKATPALFRAFPTPAAYAADTPAAIEPYIKSIGLYRNKARHIHAAMTRLERDFAGQVPRTMDDLLTLPGVARKTANVVLGNAFGINVGFVVDTHIARLAVRFRLAPAGATVATIEKRLMALFERDRWCLLSHQIIQHGRLVCKARGWLCEQDAICREFCVNGADKRRSDAATKRRSAD